jgi:hypothetical protein
MLWHILALIGVVLMSPGTPTGEHPAEDITPAEPIEFIFKDALLPEYYNEEEQEYELDFDELRQRGLVWKHSDIHPNDFGYIEPYLWEWSRNPIYLGMIDDNDSSSSSRSSGSKKDLVLPTSMPIGSSRPSIQLTSWESAKMHASASPETW